MSSDYFILQHHDVHQVRRDINDMLKDGYELAGGISCSGSSSDGTNYMQAMYKPDDLEKDIADMIKVGNKKAPEEFESMVDEATDDDISQRLRLIGEYTKDLANQLLHPNGRQESVDRLEKMAAGDFSQIAPEIADEPKVIDPSDSVMEFVDKINKADSNLEQGSLRLVREEIEVLKKRAQHFSATSQYSDSRECYTYLWVLETLLRLTDESN